MVVNVIVNGQATGRDELKNITIENMVISDILKKAGSRQHGYGNRRSAIKDTGAAGDYFAAKDNSGS